MLLFLYANRTLSIKCFHCSFSWWVLCYVHLIHDVWFCTSVKNYKNINVLSFCSTAWGLLNSEVGRVLNCKPHLDTYKRGNSRFSEMVTWDILIKYRKVGSKKVKPIHDEANNQAPKYSGWDSSCKVHFLSKLSREQFPRGSQLDRLSGIKVAWTSLQTYCIFVISVFCLCSYLFWAPHLLVVLWSVLWIKWQQVYGFYSFTVRTFGEEILESNSLSVSLLPSTIMHKTFYYTEYSRRC